MAISYFKLQDEQQAAKVLEIERKINQKLIEAYRGRLHSVEVNMEIQTPAHPTDYNNIAVQVLLSYEDAGWRMVEHGSKNPPRRSFFHNGSTLTFFF